jgi:hypothetical protein
LIQYYSNIEGSAELDYERKKQDEKFRLNKNDKLQIQQPNTIDLKQIINKKLVDTEIYASKSFTTGEIMFLYVFSIVTVIVVIYGFIKLRGNRCRKKKHTL